ncbi:MAG: O-antigen ligase family protein [Elusimicrobiota bacterium]
MGFLAILIFTATFFSALNGAPPQDSVRKAPFFIALFVLAIGLIQRINPGSIVEPANIFPSTVHSYATDGALRTWAAYAALLWCAPRVFADQRAINRLLAAVFSIGCVISIVGIVQLANDRLLMYGFRHVPYGFEPFGPYYNRDHAASMMVMAVFCGIGLLMDRFLTRPQREGRNDNSSFGAIQGLIIFGVGIILVGVLQSLSRGALAAFGACVLVLGIATTSQVKYRIAIVTAVAIASLLIVFASPIAPRLTAEYFQSSVEFRLSLYKAGCILFKDFPFLGTGLGAFQQAYYPFKPAAIAGVVEHAHSDWLEFLLQVGLPSFGICIFGLVYYLRQSVGSLILLSRCEGFGLLCGIAAALGSFLLHGLVDFNFQIPANAVLFLLLLGVIGTTVAPVNVIRNSKPVLLAAALALILIAGSVRAAIASGFVLRGTDGSAEVRIEMLGQAVRWDANPKYYYDLATYQAQMAPDEAEPRRKVMRAALENSTRALRACPADTRYRNLQGMLLRQLGRVDDAAGLTGDI